MTSEFFFYSSGDDEGFSIEKHRSFVNSLRLLRFCRDEGNLNTMTRDELSELNSIVGAASILISKEQDRRKAVGQ